jgi:predicted RNA-binding protein with PIN domain
MYLPVGRRIWKTYLEDVFGRRIWKMYLIDGNNVIGGWVGWHRDKDGSRRRLLRDLARFSRLKKTRPTVVFDGTPDHSFPEGSIYCGVKIYYSHPGSDADNRIIEIVEAARNKKDMTVVTSDRKLASRVRVCGVRVMRSGEFRQMLDETADSRKGDREVLTEENETAKWLRYFGLEENETAVEENAGRSD